MQTITLNNGVEMPVLGCGVYQVPADHTEQVVAQALDTGYRHIDTAASYQNEAAVGRAIAAAHGKSEGQVVLRWLIQRNIIAIPKSVLPERMHENLDVFDFAITADEMQQIAGMDTGTSLSFDHCDPAIAAQFATRHIDV
jgi:diketogulonate reductase-like aldo/keto reductase